MLVQESKAGVMSQMAVNLVSENAVSTLLGRPDQDGSLPEHDDGNGLGDTAAADDQRLRV